MGFKIYRKPTFSGSYLKFDSYNPSSHKRAVVKSLFERAYRLSDAENLNDEKENVRKYLNLNGYTN